MASHKTEEDVVLRHGNDIIVPKRTMTYPGIGSDDNLIFGVHVQKEKEKVENRLASLMGLMPNVREQRTGGGESYARWWIPSSSMGLWYVRRQ